MEQKSKRHVDRKGNVEWKLPDGKLHRLDGPAIEYASGNKVWCINNNFHRLDGPAIEWANGSKWWIDGKRHRLDGPAIEWVDGSKSWYIDGTRYFPFQSYLEAVKPLITEQEYFILVLTYGTEQ